MNCITNTAIYTCVVGDYDIVLPPLSKPHGCQFLLFTDNPRLDVAGWRTMPLASPKELPPNLQNRYHKLLPHRVLPRNTLSSIYVDGNVRILKDVQPLLEEFWSSGQPVGLFPHKDRTKTRSGDEVKHCIANSVIADTSRFTTEYAEFVRAGFPDPEGCLSENAILFRHHNDPAVMRAMERWWELVSRGSGRDQIPLPFALWESDISSHRFNFSYREKNPYFDRYSHWRNDGFLAWLRAYTSGRRRESRAHRWSAYGYSIFYKYYLRTQRQFTQRPQ